MTGSPSDRPPAGVDLRLLAPAAGCWAVTIAGAVGGVWAGTVATVVCVMAFAAALWALRRSYRGRALRHLLLLVIATAGVSAGFGSAITARAHHVHDHPIASADLVGHKTSVTMVIGDDPRAVRGPGPPRVRMPVRVALVTPRSGRVAAELTAPAEGWSDLVPGQRVTAVVTVDRPYRADLSAASLRTSAPPREISRPPMHQRWASTIRMRFAELSRRALPAAESGLLPGLVVGDVSGLGDDVADDFRRCGLTHLTAVSGQTVRLGCVSHPVISRRISVTVRHSFACAIGSGWDSPRQP